MKLNYKIVLNDYGLDGCLLSNINQWLFHILMKMFILLDRVLLIGKVLSTGKSISRLAFIFKYNKHY